MVKSRAWLTIVYPDSVRPDWIDFLEQRGQQVVISPLHDKDASLHPEGGQELKKSHYHVMLLWDGPTTERNAKEVVKNIGGVGCLKCASVRGSVRYFLHLDNPDKHQYKFDDMRQIGGLDIAELITSVSDDLVLLHSIYDFIQANHIFYYSDFVDYSAQNNSDWFRLVSVKYRENIYKYIKSYAYKMKIMVEKT